MQRRECPYVVVHQPIFFWGVRACNMIELSIFSFPCPKLEVADFRFCVSQYENAFEKKNGACGAPGIFLRSVQPSHSTSTFKPVSFCAFSKTLARADNVQPTVYSRTLSPIVLVSKQPSPPSSPTPSPTENISSPLLPQLQIISAFAALLQNRSRPNRR